jgi:hypothetical protein
MKGGSRTKQPTEYRHKKNRTMAQQKRKSVQREGKEKREAAQGRSEEDRM